jgi:hypothetical protein
MAFPLRVDFLALAVLAHISATHTAPVQLQDASQNSTKLNSGWSKEAIFALIGCFIAVAGILVAVIIALPNPRRGLKRKYSKYDQFLRFQEWMEMTDSRFLP